MLRSLKFKAAGHIKILSKYRLFCTSGRHFSDSSDEGSKTNDAAAKLNALLLSIAKEEKVSVPENPKIQLPKPRVKIRMKKKDKVDSEHKNLGSKIVDAAKNVATHIKGDDKEIEAQLLHKLLYKGSPVNDEILKSSSSNTHLKDILSKMTVEKQETTFSPENVKEAAKYSRAAQVRNLIANRRTTDMPSLRRTQRVNLFGAKPLGLFEDTMVWEKGVQLKTWSACEEREKQLNTAHPPSNYYEQMIKWTEKGILWKFPIDNEQGMEKEKGVSFASHVLLETHLEGWCPLGGPIRHFMELVCVGLSRNHWLTANEKEQNIAWYKDFFSQRRELIKELGAGEIPAIGSS